MRKTPESEIKGRIAKQGKITFAEFMEVALYHPEGGYYTTTSPFGDSGDYFTSPAAHPAFGALIAVQLNRMWQALGRPPSFFAVEMGAGNGLLARDIIDYVNRMPAGFAESLRYIALERYAIYDVAAYGRIQHIVTDGIPLDGIVGCLISNELVDSFPVHRFQISEGEVKEIFVTLDERGAFVETLDEPSTPLLAERVADLSLPEGYRSEVNLNIRPWLNEVSQALERGFVITIDYGYLSDELYSPQRARGTFQTYYRHTDGSSPYQRIGRQDMTAHVDFSSVDSEGKSLGLNSLGLRTQSRFLRELGFDNMIDSLRTKRLGQREHSGNVMAMRELVKPDGLGGFKVLIQERGTGVKSIEELTADEGTLPEPPLLRDDHVPLMEGSYPDMAWDMDALWPFDESEPQD